MLCDGTKSTHEIYEDSEGIRYPKTGIGPLKACVITGST